MTTTQTWTTAPLPAPRPGNRSATAGFVLGLLGLVVGWLPVAGLLVTVPALLLSRAGRKHFRAGQVAIAGRSGAGLVLGIIGTAICVVMSVVVISGGASAAPRTAAPAPAARSCCPCRTSSG
ncbi:hypothetical protein [Pseudonocardia pini]|uniref:hypothetical protein n=1 Tax=Pseudonocardia pini TaxID=2758030 RepID=UPI0015F00178|nr:hypothetical protein [Pseudonocardia pini]